MNAKLRNLIGLEIGLALVWLAWAHVAPVMWILGGIGFVPMLIMIAFEITSEIPQARMEARTARYRAGRCVDCDYDLRGSGGRCPECGREVDRPDERLAAPTGGSTGLFKVAPELVRAAWLLRLRTPTPAIVWGDPGRANIAAIVAATCAFGSGWPTGNFRPDDSFSLMIDDGEGMGWFHFTSSIESELKLSVDDDFEQLSAMTFREVVDHIARRLSTRNANPPAPASPPRPASATP